MSNDNPSPRIPATAQMVYGLFASQAIHVAAKLAIADHLEAGPKGIADLAHIAGAEPGRLDRLMRFLCGQGVFQKESDGRYALNDAGRTLLSDVPGSVRKMALFYGSPAIWASWGRMIDSVERVSSGFEAAHGLPLFPYLDAHQDDAVRFNEFMTMMAFRRSAAASYDYTGMTTVVDVGGGQGKTLIDVLQAKPDLRGVLFDLPSVVETAPHALEAAGLTGRCDVVGGSFFESVPAGGDAYILSNILHDWDDADCQRILQACRKAMQPGAKLLVVELLVPNDANAPSMAKLIDLQMMVVTGGIQRTPEEFEALFGAASFGAMRVLPGDPIVEATAI